MLHIYTGDGKGKTSAALGLALRAFGCGKRVLVTQFLKGGPTGELQSLRMLGLPVWRNSRDYGWFAALDAEQQEALRAEQNQRLQSVLQALRRGDYDCIILDELIGAVQNGSVDAALVQALLPYRADCELVLTGRNAPAFLRDAADYITEMVKHRHPFDRGIPAREGVEY